MSTRRHFLRGIGCSLFLPWLESHANEVADATTQQAKTRFGVVYLPNGHPPEFWKAATKGNDLLLSGSLEPLQDIRQHVVVPLNLWHKHANTGGGHPSRSNFLTGAKLAKGTQALRNETSVDQFIAHKLAGQTAIHSLVMATENSKGGIAGDGYSTIYSTNISWANPTTPVPKLTNCAKIFDRLFVKDDSAQIKLGLLDRLDGQAQKLQKAVSRDDRHRLEDYYTSINELEKRIRQEEAYQRQNPPPPPPIDRPAEHLANIDVRQRLMLDLMILAFRTNRTRVATFMLGNEVSRHNYSFVKGVKGSHHEVSHTSPVRGDLSSARGPRKTYFLITRHLVSVYGDMLRKMAKIDEGGASLLDNSMMLFGSTLGEGGGHLNHDLPIILGGGGGGTIKTGQVLNFKSRHDPLCPLYVSIIQRMGIRCDAFGDAQKPMSQLD